MHIYNFKFNGKAVVKVLLCIIIIAISVYFIVSAVKIYNNSFVVKNEIKDSNIINLTTKNYTNVLKSVHEDIDSYVGKKICFTGYVHRLIDFKETEFVLARDMIISSDMQTLVVGFLCECKKSKDFDNNSWVEITGEIAKGNYHGDMPIIKVKKIKQIEKPTDDIYVYPPDNTYVPTTSIF